MGVQRCDVSSDYYEKKTEKTKTENKKKEENKESHIRLNPDITTVYKLLPTFVL